VRQGPMPRDTMHLELSCARADGHGPTGSAYGATPGAHSHARARPSTWGTRCRWRSSQGHAASLRSSCEEAWRARGCPWCIRAPPPLRTLRRRPARPADRLGSAPRKPAPWHSRSYPGPYTPRGYSGTVRPGFSWVRGPNAGRAAARPGPLRETWPAARPNKGTGGRDMAVPGRAEPCALDSSHATSLEEPAPYAAHGYWSMRGLAGTLPRAGSPWDFNGTRWAAIRSIGPWRGSTGRTGARCGPDQTGLGRTNSSRHRD
jgi:hypothetical protein